REWLEAVGLSGYEEQYPAQLSGGQQQRVGLARALCTDAEILLMDEAFSALDPLIRSEMQDQLIELQEKLNKTIIFITHDLDEALRLGDRIAILKDGELVQEGEPETILLHPATDYVEAFVKDVNRARALTVETVMKPPACRITAETIGEALEQMKKHSGNQDYGYYVNDDGYQGVVLQETLEEAAIEDAANAVCEEVWEDVPAISPTSLLEEVLPETLDTDYPLPVIGEDGELKGQLSRASLAEVLGDNSANDDKKESSATVIKKAS
ncbi:MAG: ATP-binding cassette domain-containing protein, partial [Magnetovibrio sp.]|nr:ATP-binding cassette domain-containing protein [Magnetovibrio sp.]